MNNDVWMRSSGARYPTWVYYPPYTANWQKHRIATIELVGKGDWRLYINRQYIASFNSWDEARDATPMMLALDQQENS